MAKHKSGGAKSKSKRSSFSTAHMNLINTSLVPRPSPAPVFDHLQYAKTEHTASDQKLESEKAWERG